MHLPSSWLPLCLLASLQHPGLTLGSIEGADTSHLFSSARLLQQPLKKSMPLLRNMKRISSGPFVPACSRLSHDICTFQQPLFPSCCLQVQLEEKKKICICPPTGKQSVLSPVQWYSLSQTLADPKTDVFMVETYKSMAWAAAYFQWNKHYRYDFNFFRTAYVFLGKGRI